MSLSSNNPKQNDWFQRFESGDPEAWEKLVDVFYDRLVRLAYRRMEAMPPAIADQEGAVISALRSFFSGVQNGQFSRIENEVDLWHVLATITARKTIRQMRAHRKSSGQADHIDASQDIERLMSRQIMPDEEVAMIEDFQRRLDQPQTCGTRDGTQEDTTNG